MEFTFEQVGMVGIFTFTGELTKEHEDNIKIILMKAIHSIDRAVLNFGEVTWIDHKCLQLLRQAYITSVRLKNPLILINMHPEYLSGMTKNNINCRSIADEHTNKKKKTLCH